MGHLFLGGWDETPGNASRAEVDACPENQDVLLCGSSILGFQESFIAFISNQSHCVLCCFHFLLFRRAPDVFGPRSLESFSGSSGLNGWLSRELHQ